MTIVPEETGCQLTLYVSGASDRSAQAVGQVRELCDVHLPGSARLTVVDVHAHAGSDLDHSVLATPTLIKNLPLPVRRIVGDFSDPGTVLLALGLRSVVDHPTRFG
jgi:circadian clock protein KaiB